MLSKLLLPFSYIYSLLITNLMQSMGVSYLILCSESDELAPYQIICNFAQRIQQLGGDVKLVKWNGTPHVGQFLNLLEVASVKTWSYCIRCVNQGLVVQ